MTKKAEIITKSIKIEDLYEFEGNPNEQDAVTFANLTDEISVDGFEEPLAVVPRENLKPGLSGYTVV